jgi:formylmethanofuran dehydrogenase subunit C
VSTGLELALRAPLTAAADLAALTAPGWATCDAPALASRHVTVCGAPVAIGDLFTVTGTPAPALRIIGDLAQGASVGAELAEGTVTVEGNVGDNAGGARPGAKKGMRGGALVILGNAGAEAGACIRRGLIAVQGNVGPRSARAAIAGTIFVGGDAGPDAGLWSKRGSLVVVGAVTPLPTYHEACTYQPVVLRLLLLRLRALGLPITPAHLDGSWRRWSGDLAESGLGEILQWQST